jgi:hypothetical protein
MHDSPFALLFYVVLGIESRGDVEWYLGIWVYMASNVYMDGTRYRMSLHRDEAVVCVFGQYHILAFYM